MADTYEIGLYSSGSAGMVTLDSLGIPTPRSNFYPYTASIPLMDGTVRGAGFMAATWSWGYLTSDQVDALRTYCPLKSSDVYLRTRRLYEDSFILCSGVMVWPDTEEKDAFRRLDFMIEFRHLTIIELPG